MAESPNAPPNRVATYLIQQLQRNPHTQSAEIIARRRVALGLKQRSGAAVGVGDTSGLRQKTRDELEKIRAGVFQLPVEPALARLQSLPLANFPDLEALAQRLRVILQSRARLPALASHPRFDGDFFSCLKQVLVLPPREGSVPREQVIASFHRSRNRRRGKRMIALLKRELPELYALEAPWLDSLERYKPRGATATTSSQTELSSSGSGWSWAVIVLVVLLPIGRLLSRLADDKQESRPTRPSVSMPSEYSPPQSYLPPARLTRPESGEEESEDWGLPPGPVHSAQDFEERVRELREGMRGRGGRESMPVRGRDGTFPRGPRNNQDSSF